MAAIQKMSPEALVAKYPTTATPLEAAGIRGLDVPIAQLCDERNLDTRALLKALAECVAAEIHHAREVVVFGRVYALRDLCKGYIRSAFVYFLVGSTLGLSLTFNGMQAFWQHESAGRIGLAHAHLQLLGFLTMLVYGVGYQVIPSMSGRKHTRSAKLALAQLVVANIGVSGMAVCFAVAAVGQWLPLFGAFAWLGVALFVFNLW